jgi:[protein-PII] uridylyltransferase
MAVVATPANPAAVRPLRASLVITRSAAFADYVVAGAPGPLLRRLAAAVDETLTACWHELDMPADSALVAVGGYGRGELFPYSDVDVLILLASPADSHVQATIETLVTRFWDLGIDVGHSVRTEPECIAEASRDITIQTSLLEARWVVGSKKRFENLRRSVAEHLDIKLFFRAKLLELSQRHAKYQDTPFALEPNCKESPGGLRDLQVILWIARAARLGNSWSQLARRGLLTPIEARLLQRNEQLLKRLRIALHLIAKRREDRLVFDIQHALADALHISATPDRRSSEALMQRYYRAAKTVTQLNVIVLQNIETLLFEESTVEVPINERFQVIGNLLDITDDNVFMLEPKALLEAFYLMQLHPELKGMSARTLRAIWHGRTLIDAEFRADPANRAMFLEILKQPRGIVHELRRMNQLSVLGRYLPVFRRIIGQMQHDLYHVYTVDQHILMVIRNLRRFTMPEFAHEYPLCSRLVADFERHWILYVAALFHDIAKGRGGDHSELGALEAARFCRDHGLSSDDEDLVVFLVEYHLSMSRIAQKEDLSDPNVIDAFAALVGDERRLTALYVLTVADVRGTSPKVWNAWKGKLLEDLYFNTLRALGGAGAMPHADLAERQERAAKILALYDFDMARAEAFWNQLDLAWFMRHDARDIAWITRSFALAIDAPEPRVRARLSPLGEGLQVAVYCVDQPDLLARICEFFEQQRLVVLDARVHTTRRPTGNNYALDTFHVIDNSIAQERERLPRLQRDLAEHIARALPLSVPRKGRLSRQSQNFPVLPTVDLRPDERGQHFLLTLSAADRAGLLFAILKLLAERHVNVRSAKISTLGERVEDFFLVDAGDLSDTRIQLQLETELLATLSV